VIYFLKALVINRQNSEATIRMKDPIRKPSEGKPDPSSLGISCPISGHLSYALCIVSTLANIYTKVMKANDDSVFGQLAKVRSDQRGFVLPC
jgi:hypothetical protein